MPAWVTLATAIIGAIVQIVKLIMDLRKQDPEAAKECSIALQRARESGDSDKLKELIAKLAKDGSC